MKPNIIFLELCLVTKNNEMPTMYKNNSGFIAKTKVSKYKKGLCLTEKFGLQNPLLFLY